MVGYRKGGNEMYPGLLELPRRNPQSGMCYVVILGRAVPVIVIIHVDWGVGAD